MKLSQDHRSGGLRELPCLPALLDSTLSLVQDVRQHGVQDELVQGFSTRGSTITNSWGEPEITDDRGCCFGLSQLGEATGI